MKIAILGGTGKEGTSLAGRWAEAGIEVLIGSRDRERAKSAAAAFRVFPAGGSVRGFTNPEAAAEADLAVVSVSPAAHRATLVSLREELKGKTVIDLVVPVDPDDFTSYLPPPDGSAAEEAQRILGEETLVVAALHHVSFLLLRRRAAVESDVMVCGDNQEAKREVIRLVGLLAMRGIDCGGIKNARVIEALTPILLGINRRYGVKSSGIKITGIP